MSFVLDPPLLIAEGAAIERLSPNEQTARVLEGLTLALYVGVSAALYANAPGLERIYKPFGARSGREFMLGSGLVRVRDSRMSGTQHAAALSQFLLYPLWLRAGRALARSRDRSA